MNIIVDSISLIGVAIAAIAAFIFGSIWYSPMLFSKAWQRGHSLTEEDMKLKMQGVKSVMLFSFINFVVIAFALNILLEVIGAETYGVAVSIALFAGVAFVVTTKFSDLLYVYRGPHWSKNAQMLFLIEAGFSVLSYALIGSILFFFK